MTTDDYQYRIGDVYFDSQDEDEAWVEAGNIGGTYSIIRQVYCPDHLDYIDEVYDRAADELVCAKCYTQRQIERAEQRRQELTAQAQYRRERERLADWIAGRPIR
jgi:hypothetical protein